MILNLEPAPDAKKVPPTSKQCSEAIEQPPPPDGHGVAPSLEGVREFCDSHEEYVSRNIYLADAKAGLSLVAFSSAIALILQNDQFLAQIRATAGKFWTPGNALGWSASFEWVGVALCALGTILCFWVLMPRFESRKPGSPRGFTYWGDVAAHHPAPSPNCYADVVIGLAPKTLLRDRLDHLHQLSIICARKMSLLAWSMKLGGSGVAIIAGWIVFLAS